MLPPRDGAFSGLDSIEWLKLEDNAITALAGEQLFPPTLKVPQQVREDLRIGKGKIGKTGLVREEKRQGGGGKAGIGQGKE